MNFAFKNSPHFEASVPAHVKQSHGNAKITLFTVVMQPRAGPPVLPLCESCTAAWCAEQI